MAITEIYRNAGDGNWNDGSWHPGTLTSTGTKAIFEEGGTTTVLFGTTVKTGGLEVNDPLANLIVQGRLNIGVGHLADDTYRFDVISGHVIINGFWGDPGRARCYRRKWTR